MWYSPSHGLIKTPRAITKDGVDYPPQIFRKFSKEELANLGFHPARLSVADQRYYHTSGEEYAFDAATNEWVVSYGSSERNVDDIKKSMKYKVKKIAYSTLAKSDWMSIRESGGGIMTEADWTIYRAAIRTESNDKEVAIDALADLDAIKAYDEAGGVTAGWPNDPDFVEEVI